MNPQYGDDGQLNDRKKWKPFKVVCINSQSQGMRMKRLRVACRELDIKIASIAGIKLDVKNLTER